MSRCITPLIIGALLLLPNSVYAAASEALWIEPSANWHGIDGNWSSLSILVGNPAQEVDVTVSTSLAEIWIVETGGCSPTALCTSARGNVFNISQSSSWSSLGAWQLGLNYLGEEANGDYGTDTVVVYDGTNSSRITLDQQVIAAYNDTAYYTGFFGLGITPGSFNNVVEQSPLAALVENYSVVPSHSYGYTAGAYYAGQYGMPLSLTLGGYDENRCTYHDTNFTLNSTSREPNVLIRGITAEVSNLDQAPTNWSSTVQSLMSFDASSPALIDSSTPYLWLPETACDHFAKALNLTWNETFGLYLFSSDAVYQSFSTNGLSFVFSLSSTDNKDDYGHPMEVAGVVNITVSANAFAQTLRYPFMNAFNYGDAAIPYFPLKRADNDSGIIIGRAFLQEAYIIMNYEQTLFSVHQALYPENPLKNTSIVTIRSASDDPYPASGSSSNARNGMTKAQIAGAAVGGCVAGILLASLFWWSCRRRKTKQKTEAEKGVEDANESSSSLEPEPPRSPVGRLISLVKRAFSGRRNRRRNVHEIGDSSKPVELATADVRHELEVVTAPVELDASEAKSSPVSAEYQTDSRHQTSLPSKSLPTVLLSSIANYRSLDNLDERSPSSMSSSSNENNTNTNTTIPSPVSPRAYDKRLSDLIPSPTTSSPTHHLHPTRTISSRGGRAGSSSYDPASANTLGSGSINRYPSSSAYSPTTDATATSSSSSGATASSSSSHRSRQQQHPPQRTPIDPSKIVCLGPLPDNIQFSEHSPLPRIIDTEGMGMGADSTRWPPAADTRESTLGSNFTVEELERQQRKADRIEGDDDIVHVPQRPARRYSWEEER